MIGSHNTFTYLKATNCLCNIFKAFWKCQEISLQEQYNMGIRVFDIRVSETNDDKKCWQVKHGIAKVNQKFLTLSDICSFFKSNYPESVVRIMLEDKSDDESILDRFTKESETVIDKYKDMIWTIYIKRPWKMLYQGRQLNVKEYCCYLFNWDVDASLVTNIKNFSFKASSIKKWAKNNNPKITKEMIEDKDILYFMDYVNICKK